MAGTPADPRFAQLAARIDPAARLLRAWPLKGGISAEATALAVALADGSAQTWVVRRHGAADLAANPDIAALEYHLLRALHSAGLPVPAPRGLDTTGDLFGQPVVVLEYIEGAPDFAPSDPAACIGQVAAALAAIHHADLTRCSLPPLPQRAESVTRLLSQPPSQPDDALGEGRIRAALGAVWPLTPRNPSVLLHGDYWPGNWLWHDGRLAAIIDWEDAALGDPLADLGNARLELGWALGEAAVDVFTAAYQAQMRARGFALDLTDLPAWDLVAALRPCGVFEAWAEDAATRDRMRAAHAGFVGRALAQRIRDVPGGQAADATA